MRYVRTAAVLSVALCAALLGGFILGKKHQSPASAITSEGDFLRRLSAAQPHTGRYVYREAGRADVHAVYVSDHIIDPNDIGRLNRGGERDSARWHGVFWVCKSDDPLCPKEKRRSWDGDCWFERGGFVFYSGDPETLSEAKRCCDAAGL